MNAELIDAIDALLPQTQCTKCGFAGCRPYAQAIAGGRADIDQCPPGGTAGIGKLARLLAREEKPLNPAYGIESPRRAALIDESRCIGCMLCIAPCPVDAIVGAPKRMHTVLTAYCTGCELCVPPCPVDCIEMVDLGELAARGNRHAAALNGQSIQDMAAIARPRYQFHQFRIEREKSEREERLAQKAEANLAHLESMTVGHDLPLTNLTQVLGRMDRLGVELFPVHTLARANDREVVLEHVYSGRARVLAPVDAVIVSGGHVANDFLGNALREMGLRARIEIIGDALAPRAIKDAVHEGHRVGRSL